ncbi:MAG: hypothetical protein ACLUOI_39280 [Eisenbergiella sp.]
MAKKGPLSGEYCSRRQKLSNSCASRTLVLMALPVIMVIIFKYIPCTEY